MAKTVSTAAFRGTECDISLNTIIKVIMDFYNFEDAKYLPSEQITMHKQGTWELTFIVTGSGVRTIGDTYSEFSAGDLVLIPPRIPHIWNFDTDRTDEDGKVNNLTLTFPTELFDRCLSAFPDFTERFEHMKSLTKAISFDPRTDSKIAETMLKMRDEKPEDLLPYVLYLILHIEKNIHTAKVAGSVPETGRVADRINKVRRYTETNYTKPITIDSVAQHIGMNRSSFCTFFKKTTGQTYITYLNKLRVDRATTLLREGNFSIEEVGSMVGFNEESYFIRCFRSTRGMSPKDYVEGLMPKRQLMKRRILKSKHVRKRKKVVK